MDNSIYQQVESIAASNQLISSNAKKQSLNVLRDKLVALQKSTSLQNTAGLIKYDLLIIEDCYNIDMYKFQFKGVLEILQKDIDMIEKAIGLEAQNL